ncbi:MAG: hypothetical protein ISR90_07135 [Candidatus Marinimicrobia bacterium]|nr:hypothetical protein [Candidatus Neomarinimicrobiota bacterium]
MDTAKNKNLNNKQNNKNPDLKKRNKSQVADKLIKFLSKCYFNKVVNLLLLFAIGTSAVFFYYSKTQTTKVLTNLQNDLYAVESIADNMRVPNLRSNRITRGVTFADENKNMQQVIPMYSNEKDTVFFMIQLPKEFWFKSKDIDVSGNISGKNDISISSYKIEYFTTGHLLVGLPSEGMSKLPDYIDLRLNLRLADEPVKFTFVW